MEHGDKQAGVVFGGGVPHRLPGRDVAVGPRTDDPVVDLESAVENHDGVGSCVPMHAGLETSRYRVRSCSSPESGSWYSSRTPISRS
jgi:hypothetical protein